MGAFGGITGKTYDTYLTAISSYSLPDEMIFCPFIFPIQYAKSMNGGNINAPISDHNFMKDLTKLARELKHPIILLFDEGNVLTHNRVLLQKLRHGSNHCDI